MNGLANQKPAVPTLLPFRRHSTNHESAYFSLLPLPLHTFKMAVESASVASKDMKNEHLQEISNIFASEFNSKEIHDRVLCFQIIDDAEVARKDDSDNSDDSHESDNETACESPNDHFQLREKGEDIFRCFNKKDLKYHLI